MAVDLPWPSARVEYARLAMSIIEWFRIYIAIYKLNRKKEIGKFFLKYIGMIHNRSNTIVLTFAVSTLHCVVYPDALLYAADQAEPCT